MAQPPIITNIYHYGEAAWAECFKTREGARSWGGTVQGTTCASKNAAVAQAGIYSVGQFRIPSPNIRKIATVILYKDLTAHVAMATLDSTKAANKESLGEISYKLVDSVHGYQLNDREGLAKFSSVFIGTVKGTLIPITSSQ